MAEPLQEHPCPGRGWNEMGLKVPSNLKHSMIL